MVYDILDHLHHNFSKKYISSYIIITTQCGRCHDNFPYIMYSPYINPLDVLFSYLLPTTTTEETLIQDFPWYYMHSDACYYMHSDACYYMHSDACSRFKYSTTWHLPVVDVLPNSLNENSSLWLYLHVHS